MPNYKSGNKYELLDNHLATGTESTYTYTPVTPLDMKTRYHELIILVRGKATAALTLNMLINAGTNYDQAFLDMDTTTVAGSIAVDLTVINLLGSSKIDGAVSFNCKAAITLNDANDLFQIIIQGGASHEGLGFRAIEDQTSATTISTIQVVTSTSTWIAGTEITIYGIRR